MSDDASVLLKAHKSETDGRNHGYAFRGMLDPTTLLNPVPSTCTPEAIIALQCSNEFGVVGSDLGAKRVSQDEFNATNDIETSGASITVDWNLAGFNLVSVTAYETVERFYAEDADASDIPFLTTKLWR